MSTQIKRKVFDFFAANHTTEHPDAQVLSIDPAPVPDRTLPPYASLKKGDCVHRWYLSLRGEDNPMVSPMRTSPEADADQAVYRYDWAFGITVIEGLYWDWQGGLCDDSALAVHVALEPLGDAPEAVPIGATLSTLRPSRNTRSHWETALPKIGKAAADMARIGATTLPALKYAAEGITLGSNILESYTENQKNWFLYQFLDERLKCPTVEWRISKNVLVEYGSLLRGTLFLAFYGSPESHSGRVRMLLRPQVRYCNKSDICFVIPTNCLKPEEQVFIEVRPQEAKKPEGGGEKKGV